MAKGTRDVSLVIKAKNEASKALNTITTSLEKLKTSQAEVKTSSQQASDTLTRLATSTKALVRQFKSSGPDKLAASMKKASDAVSKLENDIDETIAAQKRLNSAQAQAEQQAASLAAKQEKVSAAHKASKAAAQEAVDAQNKLNAAHAKAETTLSKAGERLERYQNKVDAAAATLENARAKQARLRAEIAKGTTRESASTELADTDKSVAAKEARLQKAEAAAAEYRATIAKAEQTVESFATEQAKANSRVEETQAAFDQQKAAVKQVAAELRENKANLKQLTAEQNKLVTSLEQQESALSGAKTDFATTEQTLRDMKSQTAALAAELRSGLRTSIGQSVRQLGDYKASWQEASAAIKAAAKSGADFDNPSAELAEQIAKAKESKTAYNAMQAAIHKMRSELTAAGTDAEKLTAAQAEFEKALLGVDKAADAAANAVKAVGTAAKSSKGSLESTEQTLKGAASASASLASSLTKELGSGLVKSTRTLRDYDTTWKEATAAIKAAAKAGADFKNPSAELAQQLQTAKASKQAYNDLQQAMQVLRNQMAAAEGDTNKLKAAQKAFNSAVKSTETAMSRVATSVASAGSASSSASSSVNRLTAAQRAAARAAEDNAAAHEALSRRGRQAMTWAQRMRAEAVALASAYLGIYGAIEQLRGVTDAFMSMEAAQNRMLTAFSGDENIVGRELRWTREQAARLGIEFGVLANEYAKFAVASRETELAGKPTRDIFLAVAEAARVNKLSLEQTQGTFLALSQMLSKGVVSMEELRRQLGDRLVGAFELSAKAMGKNTREMNDLVASGQLLTVDLLPGLARELNNTFGPQLSKALNTFTTDLGRFKNEIFETQLSVGQAGFIEGLREALVELTTYLQSDEGATFFYELGESLGSLLSMLAKIPENFGAIKAILAVLVGNAILGGLTTLRLRFIAAWQAAAPLPATLNGAAGAARQYNAAGGLVNANNAAAVPLWQRVTASVTGASAAMSTVAGRAAAAATAMRGLRVAMAAVGGIPGLLITGAVLAWTMLEDETGNATVAAQRHDEIINKVIDSYSRAYEEGRKWTGSLEEDLEGLTSAQVAASLNKQISQMESQGKELASVMGRTYGTILRGFSDLTSEQQQGAIRLQKELYSLRQELINGSITARDFNKRLNAIYSDASATEGIRDYIEALVNQSKAFEDTENRVRSGVTVLKEMGGVIDDLPPGVQALATTVQALTAEMGLLKEGAEKKVATPLEKLGEQMDRLRSKVPGLKNELSMLADLDELDDIFKVADNIKGLDRMSAEWREFVALIQRGRSEIMETFNSDRFSDAIEEMSQYGTGRDLAASLLKRREGFREDPYEDNDGKLRIGFGSDEITLADESVKRVVAGMKVTATQANDDLVRRIKEFEQVVKNQIGEDRYNELTPQQQAVLISNAYNYGDLNDNLVAAIGTGNDRLVSSILRSQGDHNKGVNRDRREEEAYIYSAGPQLQRIAENESFEERLKNEQELIEKRQKYNEEFDRSLEKQRTALEVKQGISKEEAMQIAVAEAVADAQEQGITLTEERIAAVRELAADTWNIAAAEKAVKEQKQQQQIEDQKINDLQSTRQAIQQQIKFLQENAMGDNGDAVAALQSRLQGVNAELITAIDRAIAFHEAMGNTAIVENLKAAKLETTELGDKVISVKQIHSTFASTATTGLMSMAEAMANYVQNVEGSGDLWENVRNAFRTFAAEFLQQIAQMIIQQIIFNALQGAYGANGAYASAANGFVGLFHDGGVASTAGGRGRQVSPALFAGATKYHSGGVAGLAPNEMPAILERGEEILTRDDPRHRYNGGGGDSTNGGNGNQKSTTIINTIDPGEMVSKGLGTAAGEKTFINFMSRNSGKIKQILG